MITHLTQQSLTTELYWLVLTLMMTGLFWVPIIVNRISEQGVWVTLASPLINADAPWATRLMRAHVNAIENVVIFAALILMLQIVGANSSLTAAASMFYFYARLIHVTSYIFALPVVRTLAFLAGFFCQAILALTLLGMF